MRGQKASKIPINMRMASRGWHVMPLLLSPIMGARQLAKNRWVTHREVIVNDMSASILQPHRGDRHLDEKRADTLL